MAEKKSSLASKVKALGSGKKKDEKPAERNYARLRMSANVLDGQLQAQKRKLADKSGKYSDSDKANMKEYVAHLEHEKKLRG